MAISSESLSVITWPVKFSGIDSVTPYWAEFVSAGSNHVRKDTRVYFRPGVKIRSHGVCRGSVLMCNPGSAKPRPGAAGWDWIDGDTTLNVVHQVIVAAETKARRSFDSNDYIEVLNCCYITVVPPPAACGCGHFQNVDANSRFVWAAWGARRPSSLLANAAKALASAPACAIVFWAELGTKRVWANKPPKNPLHPDPQAWRPNSRYPRYVEEVADEMATHL
jgi:hypothetical protein